MFSWRLHATRWITATAPKTLKVFPKKLLTKIIIRSSISHVKWCILSGKLKRYSRMSGRWLNNRSLFPRCFGPCSIACKSIDSKTIGKFSLWFARSRWFCFQQNRPFCPDIHFRYDAFSTFTVNFSSTSPTGPSCHSTIICCHFIANVIAPCTE